MESRKRSGWILWVVAAAAILAQPASSTTLGDLSRVTARAAIVVDKDTDEVLFARNPSMPLPPASTTKLLTSVVAMKSGRLDRNVKVSKHASSMQPSKIWLQPGWTMNMRDLVYAMLLKSANDASVVVAEGLAGSVQNFSQRMNTTARSLGARGSNFVNPNGLPARGHYSTAADLAVIVRHALTIPGMRSMMSQSVKTIRPRSGSKRKITLRSTNKLLGKRSYKLIGKTGYTRRAKRCFAGAASLGGREVLVVVLGSNDLWGDLDLLVDYGLKPPAPAPDWSDNTGWRQALAPKAPKKAEVAPPGTPGTGRARHRPGRPQPHRSRASIPLLRPSCGAAQQNDRARPASSRHAARLHRLDRAGPGSGSNGLPGDRTRVRRSRHRPTGRPRPEPRAASRDPNRRGPRLTSVALPSRT